MCSGARSSSANAAMACLASVASSWSTSNRMVLSLCTISGPSVTLVSSLAQFSCGFYIDDPVDGQYTFRFLAGIKDPDAATGDGDRDNGFNVRIPQAVHHVHGDRLFEPDGLLQRFQAELRGGFACRISRDATVLPQDRELGFDVVVRWGRPRCRIDRTRAA